MSILYSLYIQHHLLTELRKSWACSDIQQVVELSPTLNTAGSQDSAQNIIFTEINILRIISHALLMMSCILYLFPFCSFSFDSVILICSHNFLLYIPLTSMFLMCSWICHLPKIPTSTLVSSSGKHVWAKCGSSPSKTCWTHTTNQQPQSSAAIVV